MSSILVVMILIIIVSLSLKRALEEREQRLVVLEECKSSLQQEALKLRSSLRDLEKSHLQARRELQELRRKVIAPAYTTWPKVCRHPTITLIQDVDLP